MRSCSKKPSGRACSLSNAAVRRERESVRWRSRPAASARARRGASRSEHEERDSRDVERVQVVLDDPVVDRVADERGPGQRDQRRDDHGRRRAEVEVLHRRVSPRVSRQTSRAEARSFTVASFRPAHPDRVRRAGGQSPHGLRTASQAPAHAATSSASSSR